MGKKRNLTYFLNMLKKLKKVNVFLVYVKKQCNIIYEEMITWNYYHLTIMI